MFYSDKKYYDLHTRNSCVKKIICLDLVVARMLGEHIKV